MENPKNRKWRVVRSEYLARKPWFTVRHETISLPDGRTIPDYYVFEYPDWVNVTAIDREGRFVMIDQYRHGLGETSYEIPAGVAEPSDETMLAAAQRELLATGVERLGAQQPDPTEDIRVHLFSRDEVLELLRTDRIRQALMAAPLWRWFAEEGIVG